MQPIARTAAPALALVLLAAAGCGPATPSPAPALHATPGPADSPGGWRAPSPAPDSPNVPAPTGSAAATVTELPVAAHEIPQAYAGHVSVLASLGSEIIWAGGPREADGDLYRYVPGAAQPELLYRNPRRDSSLASIAGSSAGYVFTEERREGGQPRGWRLWLLTVRGVEPILLDQSTDDRLPAPTLAMNDEYICWEVVRGSWDDRLNELRVARVTDPTHPATVLSIPGRDQYLEFPGLWADELWYGIVANDWTAGTEDPRIEMIDLRDPAAAPAVFGGEGRAFMPSPGRNAVAWKGGGEDGSSALNPGELTLSWRDSGLVEGLPIPGPRAAANRVSYPALGDRFVSWWDEVRPRFYLYDLAERQFRRIAEYDWAGDEAILTPSLSGNLLAYVHDHGNAQRTLEWLQLPE